MGKWNRRSQVMTLAEWMKLRFGEREKQGKIARIISALANLITSIWIISYFAVGGRQVFWRVFKYRRASCINRAHSSSHSIYSSQRLSRSSVDRRIPRSVNLHRHYLRLRPHFPNRYPSRTISHFCPP